MKQWKIAMIVLTAAFCSQASLIMNGNMSSTTYGAADQNNLIGTYENTGWVTKSSTVWSLTDQPGSMTLISSADPSSGAATNASKYAVAQVNSVTGETGTDFKLSFDWTAGASASGDALTLNYQVIGWQTTGATPLDDERWITGINFRSTQVRDAGGTTEKVDLLTGTAYGTGNDNVSEGVFSGEAGVLLNSGEIALNLGGYDMSDFDYIGVKFYLGTDVVDGGSTLADGSMLDNVQLVPEPATIGMLGLGVLITLMVRRMKRS